ncbi:sugar ABC transporter ATP-binding protein [Diplocloster hominis]|uniref:sugar ABC transporter ATP-binding protein n=1 Tax=Diplocloster hominis TaxID=3079010 RepID=UPI0031BB5579
MDAIQAVQTNHLPDPQQKTEHVNREGTELVRVEDIRKSFGGTEVLHGVSLSLKSGEIMGLAGHNGAGKSVLIKIMGGIHRPTTGKIFYEGREVRLHSAKDAQQAGFYIVPQELNLARQLSVAENIFIGRDEFSKKSGLVNKKYIQAEARRLLKEYFDVDIDPAVLVGDVDTVTQRLVQVVRCLHGGAKVIVFDETTAGLAKHERDILFDHMRVLAGKGLGIIFISHMIPEMLGICHTVTALRGGELVDVQPIETLDHNKIVEMIVGKEFAKSEFHKPRPGQENLLSVKELSSDNKVLQNISFDIRKGEILGIYGLRNQGQNLMLDILYGTYKRGGARVTLKDRPVKLGNPKTSIENGITLLTERGPRSVFYEKSIVENLAVQVSNIRQPGLFVNKKEEQNLAASAVEKFRIRGFHSLSHRITSLSGGNMQKVLIARTMMVNPDILMFVEPTQGIDIGAKEEVKKLLLEAAGQGKGILIVTAEIDDIIDICNRAVIIKEGRIRAVIESNEENRERIIEESTK